MFNVFAPAKINLSLQVTGKRPDGYHLLQSLIIFTDIGDELFLSRQETGQTEKTPDSLRISGPFGSVLKSESDNLILKAKRALEKELGEALPLGCELIKNLPVASGMGGGSADAAAFLRGALHFLQKTCPSEKLHALALSLGADVPACLYSAPAFMQGIGEILSPLPPLPPFGICLVNPLIPTATGPIFKALNGRFSTPAPLPAAFGNLNDLTDFLKNKTANDLQAPAVAQTPVIQNILDILQQKEGCRLARMTGSGATCFALFPDRTLACKAADDLKKSGFWAGGGSLFTNKFYL